MKIGDVVYIDGAFFNVTGVTDDWYILDDDCYVGKSIIDKPLHHNPYEWSEIDRDILKTRMMNGNLHDVGFD